MQYIFLFIAVAAETIGTTALQASQQFTRFWPSVIVVASYVVAFYFLSMTLKFMPVGIAYALWSALGIVFISGIAYLYYGQKLDLPAVIGLGLIIAGITVIQLFSKTVGH